MKKLIYLVAMAGFVAGTTACDDYLDTSSPSVVDPELVMSDPTTTRAALVGAYANWEDRSNCIHSGGFSYDLAHGSDIERHAETYAKQTARTVPEAFYPNVGSFSIDYANAEKAWGNMYKIIAVCNNIIASVEKTDTYTKFMADGTPTTMSQIYGEAVALRATAYFELLRHFGDLPYKTRPAQETTGFTSRYAIYESEINKLISVEPLMYRIGEQGQTANTFSRTYVQGLIGRMCLYAGGYSTRRTDLGADFYVNAAGQTLSFDDFAGRKNNAVYGRLTNYKDFYRIAQTYLQACVDNSGSVSLITTDDRATDGLRKYANPYQRKYQYMNDRQISPEAIYEIAYKQGVAGSERPYNFGRGSDGGSKNAYPCKSFGQSRFLPTYYYGEFDNKDLRRDVTVTVTGSKGDGTEVLSVLGSGAKGANGGFMNNKWDENRMSNPYTAAQRQSGIACPYLAFDDVLLMLAEVKAELGGDDAKADLKRVHDRAYTTSADADLDGFITKCGGIQKAIAKERELEFGGEGFRRYDLIRTGKLPEAIKNTRATLKAMIADLESQHYYEFENGNQFADTIWTKSVSGSDLISYRLTTQTPDNVLSLTLDQQGVLVPGWRGQNDAWEKFGCSYGTKIGSTNLAIQGLFRYIDPTGSEAAALEAAGYKKVAWGAGLLTAEMKAEYTTDWMCGYTDEDITAGNAPLHLCPLSSTILEQNPTLSNGYGFAK